MSMGALLESETGREKITQTLLTTAQVANTVFLMPMKDTFCAPGENGLQKKDFLISKEERISNSNSLPLLARKCPYCNVQLVSKKIGDDQGWGCPHCPFFISDSFWYERVLQPRLPSPSSLRSATSPKGRGKRCGSIIPLFRAARIRSGSGAPCR